MQRIFGWLGGIVFILLCLAVAATFLYRAEVVRQLQARVFVTESASTATPETFGVPYQVTKIDSHGRILPAWTVDAGPGTPAVLFFEGNGRTVHDSSVIQAYLFKHHVSSMTFDYSGFGTSTGKPSIPNLDQDAHAAWRKFATWAGADRPKFVVGYSLGSAVVLNNVASFKPPQPRGVIVYGAFNSARDLMVYWRNIPEWIVPVTPDLWDSAHAVRKLREPLLVVAGADDVTVPPIMGRQIAHFASRVKGSAFVLVPGAGHDSIEGTGMGSVWAPILKFLKARVNTGTAASQGLVPTTLSDAGPSARPATAASR